MPLLLDRLRGQRLQAGCLAAQYGVPPAVPAPAAAMASHMCLHAWRLHVREPYIQCHTP
jgi:hypothetical protein